MDHLVLDVAGQGSGQAIAVYPVAVEALGFEEYLVARFVGEANDFGLDAGTISRAGGRDLAGIQRSTIQIVVNDLVRAGVGLRNPTRNLWGSDAERDKRKGRWRVVAGLKLERIEINTGGINPWRSAGLESSELETKMLKRGTQAR